MIPLTQRPEVLAPAASLTRPQADALASIGFFRFHRRAGARWFMGNKRFAASTIDRLARMGLVMRCDTGLRLTLAGELALECLRRQTRPALPAAQEAEAAVTGLEQAIDRLDEEAAAWKAAAS